MNGAAVSLGSYTREDGTRVFQCHNGGMPVHAETADRRTALELTRDLISWHRRQGRTVHYSRWDGDRREVRRSFGVTS